MRIHFVLLMKVVYTRHKKHANGRGSIPAEDRRFAEAFPVEVKLPYGSLTSAEITTFCYADIFETREPLCELHVLWACIGRNPREGNTRRIYRVSSEKFSFMRETALENSEESLPSFRVENGARMCSIAITAESTLGFG